MSEIRRARVRYDAAEYEVRFDDGVVTWVARRDDRPRYGGSGWRTVWNQGRKPPGPKVRRIIELAA